MAEPQPEAPPAEAQPAPSPGAGGSSKGFLAAVVIATTGFFIALGVFVSFIAWRYLTESLYYRVWFSCVAVSLIAVSLLLCQWLLQSGNRTWAFRLAAVAAVLCATGLGSLQYGRITYARYGFTLYGLIPIPALDITVNSNGRLWFRNRTEQIELAEVAPLIDASTEVLVLGSGWLSFCHVQSGVWGVDVPEIQVRNTPEAFAMFNRLRSQGKRVVLVAHTTG